MFLRKEETLVRDKSHRTSSAEKGEPGVSKRLDSYIYMYLRASIPGKLASISLRRKELLHVKGTKTTERTIPASLYRPP